MALQSYLSCFGFELLKPIRRQLSLLLAFVLTPLTLQSACADLDLPTLQTNFPQFDWKKLAQGEVVTLSLPKYETDDAALAVLIAVKLNAPMQDVITHLRQTDPGVISINIDTTNQQSILAGIGNGNANIIFILEPIADEQRIHVNGENILHIYREFNGLAFR